MPLYEFECQTCGYVWENLSGAGEDHQLRCSRCGGEQVKHLWPLPNIHKGTSRSPGQTCCGREERCQSPPCSATGGCNRS